MAKNRVLINHVKKYGIYLKPVNGAPGAWLIGVSRDFDADSNCLEWMDETPVSDPIAPRIAISFEVKEYAAFFAAAIGLKPAQADIKEVM